jgi:hypothetical protein
MGRKLEVAMSIATRISQGRFSLVEEMAGVPSLRIALDDVNEMIEEFIRSWTLFKTDYEKTKTLLFNGEIKDVEATGRGLLEAIDAGQKAADSLDEIRGTLQGEGRLLDAEAEFNRAKADLHALKERLLAKWPFVDLQMVGESRAAYARGEFQSIEEIIDELERQDSAAS